MGARHGVTRTHATSTGRSPFADALHEKERSACSAASTIQPCESPEGASGDVFGTLRRTGYLEAGAEATSTAPSAPATSGTAAAAAAARAAAAPLRPRPPPAHGDSGGGAHWLACEQVAAENAGTDAARLRATGWAPGDLRRSQPFRPRPPAEEERFAGGGEPTTPGALRLRAEDALLAATARRAGELARAPGRSRRAES